MLQGMQALADETIKILVGLIVMSVVNLLPFTRLKSIDATLKGMRRDMRRSARRIDLHDKNAGIDTRAMLRVPRPAPA